MSARLADGGPGQPSGAIFRRLPAGLAALARRVSHAGPIAYLEADMFGGISSQAAVVWRAGQVCLGPVVTEFEWPPPGPAKAPLRAFNQALRELGMAPRHGLR